MSDADISSILRAAVVDGRLPGAAGFLVDRDRIRDSGAAGWTGTGCEVTERTLFRYASATKLLTSIAVLQLVEQGRLDLDASAASLVPELAGVQVLDGFDGEAPVLRPPVRMPTVRELLTHTSGLGYFFANAKLARYHDLTGAPFQAGQRAALHLPLVHDPGEAFEYGTGLDWAGLIVEAVSGEPLDSYLEDHLTSPLGMTDTTFHPTPEQRSRLMVVHLRQADDTTVPTPIELPAEPDWWAGGHGLYGTAVDYARLIRCVLRGGELDGARVIAEATIEEAFRNQLGGLRMPEGIPTSDPIMTNDIPPLPVKQGWGLACRLALEAIPGGRDAGSGDWGGLFNLHYWIDRRHGIGGMLLTQLLPFCDPGALATYAEIESQAYLSLGDSLRTSSS